MGWGERPLSAAVVAAALAALVAASVAGSVALALQASPSPVAGSPDPFFTDDLFGVAKVITMIVAPIIGAVWALMRGSLQRKDADLEGAINGVGARVNRLEERAVRLESWRGEVDLRMGRHEDLIHDLKENYGKVAAAGDALRREIGETRVEIARQIAAEGAANREQIHAVEIQVARIASREG